MRSHALLFSAALLGAGRVSGGRMQLRVRVGDDTLGPFTLQRGVAPQLFKCL